MAALRLPSVAQRLLDLTWLRYVAASVGALAFDFGLFLILVHGGINSMIASATGYSCGILVHWLISSRTVFADRTHDGAARTRQKALFVVSALAGLACTTAIVGGGEALGFDPRVAKLVAIVVSFQLTYVLRARFIFTPEAA